jgi:hypothetical protein
MSIALYSGDRAPDPINRSITYGYVDEREYRSPYNLIIPGGLQAFLEYRISTRAPAPFLLDDMSHY